MLGKLTPDHIETLLSYGPLGQQMAKTLESDIAMFRPLPKTKRRYKLPPEEKAAFEQEEQRKVARICRPFDPSIDRSNEGLKVYTPEQIEKISAAVSDVLDKVEYLKPYEQ